MVSRSIPLRAETIGLMLDIAQDYVLPGCLWLDLGCSHGSVLERVRHRFPDVDVAGSDSSVEMVQAAFDRLGAGVALSVHDLRLGLPDLSGRRPTVISLLWTAQFVPLEHRQRLYRQCREALAPGGMLFVAEKLRGQTSRFQELLVRKYLDWKVRQGYGAAEVAAKARALEGVLVGLDAPQQKGMLQAEGFEVEEVIRYLSFAAWVCLPR